MWTFHPSVTFPSSRVLWLLWQYHSNVLVPSLFQCKVFPSPPSENICRPLISARKELWGLFQDGVRSRRLRENHSSCYRWLGEFKLGDTFNASLLNKLTAEVWKSAIGGLICWVFLLFSHVDRTVSKSVHKNWTKFREKPPILPYRFSSLIPVFYYNVRLYDIHSFAWCAWSK